MCIRQQHFWCSHGGPICRRSILEGFFEIFRQDGSVLKKGKAIINSLKGEVKTTSGSSDGSGCVLAATGLGLFLGAAEVI